MNREPSAKTQEIKMERVWRSQRGQLLLKRVNGHISGNTDVYQERLTRLENDKESLVLQVSVLTDQVEAQGEKIRDLEFCLEEHREKLNDTEEMLQQELLSRTSLESQKLDLMAEISNLKLKLATVEKDHKEFEERYKDTEGLMQEMNELRLRVSEMENERSQFEKKLKSTKPLMAKLSSMKIKVGQIQYEKQRTEHKCQALKDELSLLKEELEQKEADLKTMKENVERPPEVTDMSAGNAKDLEMQKMKKAIESLMAVNEEKEQKMEELRQCLSRYKKVQDMVVLAQGKKGKEVESDDSVISGSNSLVFDGNALSDADKSPSPLPISTTPSPEELPADPQPKVEMHTSILQVSLPSIRPFQQQNEVSAPAPSEEAPPPDVGDAQTSSLSADVTTPEPPGSPVKKCSSLGNLEKEPAELGTASPELGKFQTLPPRPPATDDESFGSRKSRSSFGRGFFKMKNSKKTSSTPNLDRSRSASAPALDTEKGSTDHLDLAVSSPNSVEGGSPRSSPSSPDYKKKTSGIRKLFGKLKRSQSTTLNQEDDLLEEEFKRGGTRSTAGPRLGWSRDLGQVNSELDTPFAKWTKDQVCSWLRDQGLGGYVNSCKQWIVSGQTLLHASQQDLEKELGIKQPLHRKKLQLALQSLGSEDESNYGRLDYRWVTRWLDDIGLPQYKTQFDDAKLDGRMLHYLAVSNISPSEVAQWTNHRVMEWLRSVDLAEYAPNLRGSGVHGGLMVLEPRFNHMLKEDDMFKDYSARSPSASITDEDSNV
ncbi:hypothetical protein XELAEV_18016636mg [Xenopus laevis]|uniref:SAM domain-containing protein n=1 Tax=Xenopus laevis TaxID=8355 RepID=A0A974HRM8_XENLA|nr:hypothetical protein XELAEV_18016636mg [Xenopus laevis]